MHDLELTKTDIKVIISALYNYDTFSSDEKEIQLNLIRKFEKLARIHKLVTYMFNHFKVNVK